MAGLALALFVALFSFGQQYFGWEDTQGRIQLALFSCFVLGLVCGLKAKA